MKPLQIFLLLALIPVSLLSQSKGYSAIDDLDLYRGLNDKELRLPEFKDNDEVLKIKLIHLDVINRSRKKSKVPPVKLDILASRVANRMCREAAENSYVSHWDMEGEKPYHRYAFSGGYDHVSENAFGEWTSGNYNTSNSEILKMMESGHSSFMSERAPNDGHKKNIIERSHNFVGIGFFASENQFRYYEEFVDRYFEFENIPSDLKINETGSITVKTDGSNFLYFLIIYREKFPAPLKVAQLKKTGSYQDYTNEEYLKLAAWELAAYRNGNTYNIPLKFSREGLYYIHIYFDKKEIKNPSALNTKGKAEGSGIVIRVEK
jgi:Cysteine-rich secretory protein family